MTAPAKWREWPMVCRPRYGSANSKAYRAVRVWQPPNPLGIWLPLGSRPYRGPLRSLVLVDCDAVAWLGNRLVWAHMLGARL